MYSSLNPGPHKIQGIQCRAESILRHHCLSIGDLALCENILEGLTHDVVLGEHCLETLRVFSDNEHALLTALGSDVPTEINRITCPGTMDKSMSWIKQKLHLRQPQTRANRKFIRPIAPIPRRKRPADDV